MVMEKLKNIIGKLLFEGEYLNGKKWNGNGQEYIENDQCHCSWCCYFRKYEYLFGRKYIKQQY